jgi:hypothetical protein
VDKIKKRGRRRIRTAEYWREYYTRKQREWRAAHPRNQSRAKFYSRSHDDDAQRQQKMWGYEMRHRAAAQMSSSTTLTVGCQCVRLQSIYKDALQCPQRTRLENKL